MNVINFLWVLKLIDFFIFHTIFKKMNLLPTDRPQLEDGLLRERSTPANLSKKMQRHQLARILDIAVNHKIELKDLTLITHTHINFLCSLSSLSETERAQQVDAFYGGAEGARQLADLSAAIIKASEEASADYIRKTIKETGSKPCLVGLNGPVERRKPLIPTRQGQLSSDQDALAKLLLLAPLQTRRIS